jgi:hypothetical protein
LGLRILKTTLIYMYLGEIWVGHVTCQSSGQSYCLGQ